jgi:hypothetical protein
MSLADQIRAFTFENFLGVAFEQGQPARISAGEIHKAMGFKDRIPAVVSAIGGRIFQEDYGVALVKREGRPVSSRTAFEFAPRGLSRDGLSPHHLDALKWFEAHSGEFVAWALLNDRELKLAISPKGIYRPAAWPYALSIKIIPAGRYPDEEPELRDGRYTFRYHQEEPAGQNPSQYVTNLGLAACVRDDVPVGVVRQVKPKPSPLYEVLGLGRVTRWQDGFFTIELEDKAHEQDDAEETSDSKTIIAPKSTEPEAPVAAPRQAFLRVRDITEQIRFSDQIYGRGSREAPVLTFARNAGAATSYTKTALSKLQWPSDYIIQYIPQTAPKPRDEALVGKLVSLVSIYPKEGRTVDFLDPERTPGWDVGRWPDAIMLREVFWFVDPPELKPLLTAEAFAKMTSHSRNRLGEPPPELYEAIRDLQITPILDLYRSPVALQYLRDAVEPNPSMQVVANRRTGKAGYVYALSLPEFPGFLKIGSAFDPGLRARGLSTAIPTDFTIQSAVFFEDCRVAERAIHTHLDLHRHRLDREWFRCSLDDFHDAAEAICGDQRRA